MIVSAALPTLPLEHPTLDYAFLRQQGIQHLEQMVGEIWTDFNSHDPGITILEQLCYALTDLGYRINHSLPDLLASQPPNTDTLFTPSQILPSYPVTLTDLRKLVVDVIGVRNAWIEQADTQAEPLFYDGINHTLSQEGSLLVDEAVHLRGLYRVLLDISDASIDETIRSQNVVKEVQKRLHAHRGLGEDFVQIKPLAPQDVAVRAIVEIAAVENAEDILLHVLQRLADHISPPVTFFTLQQMLAVGKRFDEIFDGPLLNHGFIDSAALRKLQRRHELRTSDLIQEIMDVSAVKAVRAITVSTIAGQNEVWLLKLDPAAAPRLRLPSEVIAASNGTVGSGGSQTDLRTEILLQRNGLPVQLDINRVILAFEQWRQSSTSPLPLPLHDLANPLPTGQNRDTGNYYSIQHQFPATYGIGELGLPDSAAPQRKAQAKQLKAYLLFFDQLLANYFAQLAHVKDLFSTSPPTNHTYFSQLIQDPSLKLDDVLQISPAELQEMTEISGSDRQNRFLNHLLARFAEQFTDYALLMVEGLLAEQKLSTAEKIAQDKQAFLQAYPALSRARGTGFNYLLPRSEENQSGLEKRLRYKLGLRALEERFILVEHILLRPMVGDSSQTVPILRGDEETPLRRDPYSLQLTFIFPDWPERFKHPAFKTFVERTVREETPAHLTLTIQWLDKDALTVFETAYENWLEKLRGYWSNQLGV